jgi:hypothetical protein
MTYFLLPELALKNNPPRWPQFGYRKLSLFLTIKFCWTKTSKNKANPPKIAIFSGLCHILGGLIGCQKLFDFLW